MIDYKSVKSVLMPQTTSTFSFQAVFKCSCQLKSVKNTHYKFKFVIFKNKEFNNDLNGITVRLSFVTDELGRSTLSL